ncbi:MAG: 6,7-dimethyl-8-ribityllumazine synthase [Pseudomonadota bacterium]
MAEHARKKPSTAKGARQDRGGMRLLVVEARFYEEIGAALAEGAVAELAAQDIGFDVVSVPGALEIPQVLAKAVATGALGGPSARYQGVVVLGCVIRGETSHYDIVCNNANHWLMEVAIRHAVPVGNAILTVDTEAQALARAKGGRQGKGADAVRACLALIDAAAALTREPR